LQWESEVVPVSMNDVCTHVTSLLEINGVASGVFVAAARQCVLRCDHTLSGSG